MRYRIGEVAEFFGITKEGVRFLERQGIIRSERDEENSYRYFTRQEITRLKQIRSYQTLGFSLEEAADMVSRTRREDLLMRIDEKLAELTKKEEQIHRMRGMLLGQRQAAQSVLGGESSIGLTMRPEILLFPAVREEASGATPAEREAIAQARHAEKIWIQNMPPVMLGDIRYDAQGKSIFGRYGSVAKMEAVSALGLPVLPCMIHLPACWCVSCLVEGPLRRGVDIEPLRRWAAAHGYKPWGEVFSLIRTTYCDENGELNRIREVFLPIEE